MEIKENGASTTLLFTEQNTYINAPADANAQRIRGVSWHLDNLLNLVENGMPPSAVSPDEAKEICASSR